MCGMAGVFTSQGILVDAEIEAARKLMILNHFRGADSAGLMWYNANAAKKKPMFNMDKWHNHPLYVAEVNWPKINKEIWDKQDVHMIGIHCRAATIGKVDVNNAHPFKHEHIIGMHNGTINGSFTNKEKFGTDSEALIYNIAQAGIEETIKDLDVGLPAYALVWLDTKKRTLNFLRNGQRPLHVFHQGTTLYWSSDKKDLDYVFHEKVKYKSAVNKTKHGHEKDVSLYLQVNQHYEIDLDASGEITWEMTEIKPPEKHYNYPTFGEWTSETELAASTTTTKPTTSSRGGTSSSPKPIGPVFDNDNAYKNIVWVYLNRGDLKDVESTHLTFMHPAQSHETHRYYIPECDGWVRDNIALTVALWRMHNFDKSLALIKQNWQTAPLERQGRILRWTDMTRSQMEVLLRGKYFDYHNKPFLYDCYSQKRLYAVFLDHEIADAKALAANGRKQRKEDAADFKADEIPFPDISASSTDTTDNVIPLPDKSIPNTSLMNYPFGSPQRFGTKVEITKHLYKGCVYCDNGHDWKDYLDAFWVGPEDYLCKSCQDAALDGAIDLMVIPNHNQLKEFVIQREERAKHLAKVANNHVMH